MFMKIAVCSVILAIGMNQSVKDLCRRSLWHDKEGKLSIVIGYSYITTCLLQYIVRLKHNTSFEWEPLIPSESPGPLHQTLNQGSYCVLVLSNHNNFISILEPSDYQFTVHDCAILNYTKWFSWYVVSMTDILRVHTLCAVYLRCERETNMHCSYTPLWAGAALWLSRALPVSARTQTSDQRPQKPKS